MLLHLGLLGVIVPNSVILSQPERNYGELPENLDHSLPAFQDHSRLLETARIVRLPVTSY